MDVVAQRLVLDQLEQRMLIHHLALGGGQVTAHFEGRLVGQGNMALVHVGQHVRQALGQAFALGVYQFLLRFRIGRQEIGRRHGVDDLLHGKADFLLLLGRGFHRFRHGGEEFGIEQV